MSDPTDPLAKAESHMRKHLTENNPEAVPDYDMLLSLTRDNDDSPFDPSAELRLNDMALRAYCELNEFVVKLGQVAGLQSSPTMLSFLLGLQLGHRVAREQIGRTP